MLLTVNAIYGFRFELKTCFVLLSFEPIVCCFKSSNLVISLEKVFWTTKCDLNKRHVMIKDTCRVRCKHMLQTAILHGVGNCYHVELLAHCIFTVTV